MARYEKLAALLPSLYRPESGDETLLNRLLQSTGATLDDASVQANHVMFSHWFDVADKATWDAHHQTERRERGLPPVNVRNARDQREILTYPYIADLARLCGLLGITPWREPALLRESVEEYRQRVIDLLDAYRRGLTTVPALRRLIEAELPEQMAGTAAELRWPFAIEEPRALLRKRIAIAVPESPLGDIISPLWRWSAPADTEAQAIPTVYLQGVAASGDVQTTENPGIECITPFHTPTGVALTYSGTLAPGQTLRLTPARRSFLIVDHTLMASPLPDAGNIDNDPAANGPWQAVAALPEGRVAAISEAIDNTLWFIIEDDTTLHRFDGNSLQKVETGSPDARMTCVFCFGDRVFVGTDKGLYQCNLFPDIETWALEPVPTVTSEVYQMTVVFNHLTVASHDGLFSLNANLSVHKSWLSGQPVYAVIAREQKLYLGVNAGLVRCLGHDFALYEGNTTSEEQQDWRVVAETDIAAATGGVAPVRQMAITPDGSLWLGNATGLARYYARAQENGSAYQTMLEAYPDLCNAVHTLVVDTRGMLWIGSDAGLLRFDGRDIARIDTASGKWQVLGEASCTYPDELTRELRGHWRYNRDETAWQRYHTGQQRFGHAAIPLRTQAGTSAQSLLFANAVIAEIGEFDGTAFKTVSNVPATALRVRVKPDQTRICDGGLPGLPRPINATSSWRYIEREDGELLIPNDRPWWSREGQLFPEPPARFPWPGHFRNEAENIFLQDARSFDPNQLSDSPAFHPLLSNEAAIYIYPPSARVWMEWPSLPQLGVKIRLFKRAGQPVDPAITDRVWTSMQRARAASVPMALLVEDRVVHGPADFPGDNT